MKTIKALYDRSIRGSFVLRHIVKLPLRTGRPFKPKSANQGRALSAAHAIRFKEPLVLIRYSSIVLALFSTLLGVAFGAMPAIAAPTAQSILERADQIRFPKQPFQVSVRIDSETPGKAASTHTYRVLVKGNENSLVQTLSPPAQKGQVLLMKGSDLWVFLPKVSQPVRLPLSKRLTGQVANGDLARANFTGDYTPSLVKTEAIKGTEYYVLELLAARRGVTYDRVLFWVEVESFKPYKAEFYTRSKRLIKVGYYRAFRDMGGALRPSELLLEDRLKKGERSVLRYSEMKIRDIPDRFFNKQFLKKLK